MPVRFGSLALLVFLSPSSVTAQASNFIDTLKAQGLSQFADAVFTSSSTTIGQSVLAQLGSGNNDCAVFAPTDEAFARANVETLVGGDPNTLASIIAYHVAAGDFTNHSVSEGSPDLLETATWPDITIAESLLDGRSPFVNLEGGKGQACPWARNPKNGTVFFWGQPSNPIALNATQVTPTILLVPISAVLNIPGNLSSVFEANDDDASSLSKLLSINKSDSSEGSIMARFESDATRGFTFFAPNNDAIKAAGRSLTDLIKNETALDVVIRNHYVNGSTFYSTQITNSTNLVSASGQPFTFTTTSNGTYVTSGKTTAKIVDSNYLVKNGVLHWIDTVLRNLEENESAAQSAYQSVISTAAAAAFSTVTGPITAGTPIDTPSTTTGPITTSTPTNSEPSSSGGSNNGANWKLNADTLNSKLAFVIAILGGLFCF